ANRDDTVRQTMEDLVDGFREHLARTARREDEAERIGTEGDREQRVLLIGDAADLDPHRVRGYRTCSGGPRTLAPWWRPGHRRVRGPNAVGEVPWPTGSRSR